MTDNGFDLFDGLPGENYGLDTEASPPSAPLSVAREHIYTDLRTKDGLRTVVAWRGGWMIWRITHWAELDTAQLRSHIYHVLENATYWHKTKDGTELRNWHPDKHKIANIVEALAALTHLTADVDPPSWIGVHSAAETSAGQVISCANGLLDLSTRTIHDHTPALFNVVSVPFDYQEDAAATASVAGVLRIGMAG